LITPYGTGTVRLKGLDVMLLQCLPAQALKTQDPRPKIRTQDLTVESREAWIRLNYDRQVGRH
jgi:hypothetical protein